MNSRTLALATLTALLGCVPETRVEPRDVPDGGSDSAGLDVTTSDQPTEDTARDVAGTDRSVDDRHDSSRVDVLPQDVVADASSNVDVSDASVDPGDRSRPSDVLGESDGSTDAGATDAGCPACAATNAVAACIAGVCRIGRCNSSFGDCNGAFGDGCETALSSMENCGGCGFSCGANGVCVSGRCTHQRSCPMTPERGCGLVSVEGGSFQLGSPEASTGEPLPGTVTVSSVLVDTHEVTVARFRRFWLAGHPVPSASVRYPNGTTFTVGAVTEPVSPVTGSFCNWTSGVGSREAHPLNCVDWSTAQAFCVWDGARLPSEAEYEYISRIREVIGYPSPRRYPWGDAHPIEMSAVYPRPAPCERAQFENCIGDDGGRTRRVASFPVNGGIFDLAGNVAEWVADAADNYGFAPCWGPAPVTLLNPICVTASATRSTRGSSFAGAGRETLLAASRSGRTSATLEDTLGFRCVRSP
jgi:sulfatase modifying factor 1